MSKLISQENINNEYSIQTVSFHVAEELEETNFVNLEEANPRNFEEANRANIEGANRTNIIETCLCVICSPYVIILLPMALFISCMGTVGVMIYNMCTNSHILFF
jgi:hypothetical protein